MLVQRIITAIGLVAALALVLLVLPQPLAVAALAVIVLAGAWEWTALAGLERWPARVIYLVACVAAMAGLWFATQQRSEFESAMVGILGGWIVLFGWVVFAPRSRNRWLAYLAGLWVLAPMWLALARLYLQSAHGHELVIFVLLLAWAADIGGFVGGRRFGRLKLAPVVSPNKTWEGVLGGLIAGFLVGLAGTFWFDQPPLAFLSICTAAVLMSVAGDLVESMFKRQAGRKDSGSLLPGHGGVLDRIDSLTSSAPLLALGFCWLGLVA